MGLLPPPGPLDCLVETLPAGSVLYRVHHPARRPDSFNPGYGEPTRFAFFGDPVVPVLYAGASPEVAVFERIFHDAVPGSVLPAPDWLPLVLTVLRTTRDIPLAQMHSDGLRRLDAYPRDITDTPPTAYPDTVRWAEAAHARGDVGGIVWMSRQFNSDRSYVLFGDRVGPEDLEFVAGHPAARAFATVPDIEWLSVLADRMDIMLTYPGGA